MSHPSFLNCISTLAWTISPALFPEWFCPTHSFSQEPEDVHSRPSSHTPLHNTFVFPEPDRAWGFHAVCLRLLSSNIRVFGEHERIVSVLMHLQYVDYWIFLSCLYVYQMNCCSFWREWPAVIIWWFIYKCIKDVGQCCTVHRNFGLVSSALKWNCNTDLNRSLVFLKQLYLTAMNRCARFEE